MKKLLAIAVASALLAPAAAMADTTLYGHLNASVNNTKTTTTVGGVSTSVTDNTVDSNASRIGIKGSTALDNGMDAIYGLEYGINLDGANGSGAGNTQVVTAGSTLQARNTFVGLKGKFGTVLAGRHDTPAKLATAGLDVFADTKADMNNIIVADTERVDNAVAYINKFGPVTAAVAHSTGVNAAALSETGGLGEANTAMVSYGNGPWTASLGHTTIASVRQNTNLGLGWKSEAGHNVGLVYETAKAGANGGAAFGVKGGANGKDTNVYLGGGYKVGNVMLKAAYGQGKSKDATGASTGGTQKLETIGADYSLAKSTKLYALLSDNKNAARTALTASDKVQTASVGLVTDF